jgi:hypothetical protein
MRKVNPLAVLAWVVIAVALIWIRSRPSAPPNVAPNAESAATAIRPAVSTNSAGLDRAADAAGGRRARVRTNSPQSKIERAGVALRPDGRPTADARLSSSNNPAGSLSSDELTASSDLLIDAYRAGATAEQTNALMNVDPELVTEGEDDQTPEAPTPDAGPTQ